MRPLEIRSDGKRGAKDVSWVCGLEDSHYQIKKNFSLNLQHSKQLSVQVTHISAHLRRKLIPFPSSIAFSHKFYFNLFLLKKIFLFYVLAVLGLLCCSWSFSSCGKWGLLFVAVHGLLFAVASLVAEHELQACGFQQLWHTGSVVVACGLSCSTACGIFLDQGQNLCPLCWQVDS